MKTVSVVIPVYKGAETLPFLFKAFCDVEKKLVEKGVSLHLIFVDDGSRDDTYPELLNLKTQRQERITIIKLTKNFGAICASNAGLKYVKGDAFTIYAADMQDPPELLVQMVDKWLEGKKYIICQRNIKRKDPLSTRLFAFFYYKLINVFVVKDFPKTGFDIMFWDSQFLPYIKNTSKNINRSLYAHWLGVVPEVIMYDRPERMHGKSKWTFNKKVKLFVDSFLGFSMLPIRISSIIGGVVAVCSFVYACIIVIGSILGNVKVPGYASLMASTSFLMGIVILMLGVIGEYVWRIFDEVNKRPEAVIEEVLE
ncbi:MAG: glycosyltransferase [Bacteroidia bacterium]|jgi:dolichol-phosphate mannosyltransferase